MAAGWSRRTSPRLHGGPINPQWLERSASHLLRWEHSIPGGTRCSAAMCDERASLYGLPAIPNRKVNLQRVDPILARELFIRHALVENRWDGSRHAFVAHNQTVLAQIEALGDRLRRDISVDEHTLSAFNHRIPEHVVSVRHFTTWWKRHSRDHPDALNLSVEELSAAATSVVASTVFDAYPDEWPWGDRTFRIDYTFDPAAPDDGITIEVPLDVVVCVEEAPFRWLVPALRKELVVELSGRSRRPPDARSYPSPRPPRRSCRRSIQLALLLDQLAAAANQRGSETTARAFRPDTSPPPTTALPHRRPRRCARGGR